MTTAKRVKHLRVPPTITVAPNGVETFRPSSDAVCGVRITPSIGTRIAAEVTCPACRVRMEVRS